MKYTIRFKGGPIGGEIRDMDQRELHGRRIPVPVFRPIRFTEERAFPGPSSTYGTEWYQLWPIGHAKKDGEWIDYEARWEDPNDGLHKQIQELTAKVAQLEQEQEVLEALRTLTKHLQKGKA